MDIFSKLNTVSQRPFVSTETEATATNTTTMSLPPSSSAPTAPNSGIPGLETLAEWNQGQLNTLNQVSQPPSKKQKAACASPTRIPLPNKPQGAFAAKLNDLTQIHHLRAEYIYAEGPPQAFSSTLALMDMEQKVIAFHTSTASSSKKAAKEDVAKQATEWLEQREVPKKVEQTAGVKDARVVDKFEDWISLLNVFCLQTRVTSPDYAIYVVGPDCFSATCTISGQIYGDKTVGYASKKNAKAVAARAAVLKMREEGIMGRRPSHMSVFAPSAASSSSSTPSVNPTPSPTISGSTASATSLIPPICHALNLTQPTYKIAPDPPGSAFSSGAAYFDGALEPALRGPVGAVDRVFGKKNAKDQCAKLVLEVLERVKQERLAA